MRERAIPDYLSTPGIEQLAFHRRRDNEFAHFQLITYWRDLKDIEGFAGSDSGLAKYYPEDEQYLLEFEERVQHYDVFAMVDVT
ncbi:MAG: antibiotic biosynthesis monooxygenase [Planctomycetota bacterium]